MSVNTGNTLSKFKIKPIKSLGQNFLTDINVIKNIVSAGDVCKDDLVIEIGPGIGAMTCILAESAGKVIAIEIDKHIIPALEDNLNQFKNVHIINEDILKININELTKDWKGDIKIIANLPYYITTPIIMGLLEKRINCKLMVFMMQKEVAKRMNAKPGNKDYGSLTIAINFYATTEYMFEVSKNCFIPKPDVESAVVKFNIKENQNINIANDDVFFKTIKAAFAQRRKTIVNSFANSKKFPLTKDQIKTIFTDCNIDHTIRGENLSINQFAEISNRVNKELNE